VTEHHKEFAQGFNDYAWLLATGTREGIRNGVKAVELASEACRLTDWKNAAYLDTLAAAYAEKGEFDAALEWQTKAVQTAKDEPQEVRTELESRIPLYKARKPYREEPKE
jgi:hypothetical protein